MRARAGVGELELRERPGKDAMFDGELVELDERSVARVLEAIVIEVDAHVLSSLLCASNRRYELDPRPLRARLRSAVERKELVFVRGAVVTVNGKRPEQPPEYVPPAIEDEQLDWIEILVEDQDGRPMRELDYELTLPDGAVRRGRTNREGFVRLDEIPKGECKFSLLEPASAG